MFLPRTQKRLTLQQPTTFLSPAAKFNQRSFSASSLPSPSTLLKPAPSLRDEVRLESFKRSVFAQSKLSKTALHKATLKVGECGRQEGEVARLRMENQILRNQKHEDLQLIARQNEVIRRLEEQIKTSRQKNNPCQCYLNDQYLLTIRNLEAKVRHMDEEKKEFKYEIRNLVVQQEQLKAELAKIYQQRNNKIQELVYNEQGDWRKAKPIYKKRQKIEQKTPQRAKEAIGSEGLQRYLQYLKNQEIDQIEAILK